MKYSEIKKEDMGKVPSITGVNKSKEYIDVNNMKFAGDLKKFISELFGNIDIEKTKDDSSVEIIKNKQTIIIGNKNSGEQKPFIRGSLISFGQYVRNEIKNDLMDKLKIDDTKKYKKNELKQLLKTFNHKNNPDKIFDANEIFNKFTGVDTVFNEDTILKLHISETGEIKEFTGKELFKETNKLFSKFIEKNIDIIINSEDIWTEIALKNQSNDSINVITDARFLTECEISLETQKDSFLTVILPLTKDSELLLKNYDEIFNLYKNSSNIEDFISIVAKPSIFNQNIISDEEINDFIKEKGIVLEENISIKDRETIYQKYIEPLLSNEDTKKEIPTKFLKKITNEAEELSTLIVLHKYLSKHKPELINNLITQDLKAHNLDKTLVVESIRGDFKGLIQAANDIKNEIDNSESQMTLLSTISGGGKDTVTSILENVAIKKLPFNDLINETYKLLSKKLDTKNIERIIKEKKLNTQESILKYIIDELPKEHKENAQFLTQISTLNISFINDIGKILKEDREKKQNTQGLLQHIINNEKSF